MKKPGHLSWVEAASIPENYLTGKYSGSLSALFDYNYSKLS